jgi:hypothetical protein
VWRSNWKIGLATGTGPAGYLRTRSAFGQDTDTVHLHSYGEFYEFCRFRLWGNSPSSPQASMEYVTSTNWIKALGFRGVGIADPAQSKSLVVRLGFQPGGGGVGVLGTTCAISVHQSVPEIGVDRTLYQNRNGKTQYSSTIALGATYNTVEIYGAINTIGTANGVVRVWCNGLLVLEYTDITWRSTAPNGRGFYVGADYSLTLGGGGPGAKTRLDGIDFDTIYQSFKTSID